MTEEEVKKTIPPCGECTEDTLSTAVCKIVSNPLTMYWLSSLVKLRKIRAAAVVCIQSFDDKCQQYIVITPTKMSSFQYFETQLKCQLKELEAKVEWIRPLDRRLQRLLGWGDVWVDKEEVLKADNAELAVIFPASIISKCP